MKLFSIFLYSISLCLYSHLAYADEKAGRLNPPAGSSTAPMSENEGAMAGMDEAVNEKFAEAAGLPPRDPYINTEAMGDLWNMLLLLGGGVCGFIIGRWWHLLWGKSNKDALLSKEKLSA